MIRNATLGAVVFGLLSAAAGYVWVSLEFPFAIALPALVGWYLVTRAQYPGRTALTAALVGGVSFTALLIAGLFLAITDGSPAPVAGWLATIVAAAAAGAITGWVLGKARGAAAMAVFSAGGMLAAVLVNAALRQLAPAGTDVPGFAQSGWAALLLAVVGVIVGAAIGAGTAWVARDRGPRSV